MQMGRSTVLIGPVFSLSTNLSLYPGQATFDSVLQEIYISISNSSEETFDYGWVRDHASAIEGRTEGRYGGNFTAQAATDTTI